MPALVDAPAKPLIYCARSIIAWQQGAKTQTRRLVKPQPPDSGEWRLECSRGFWVYARADGSNPRLLKRQPYAVSDLLWIREGLERYDDAVAYSADGEVVYSQKAWEEWHGYSRWSWKRDKLPAMFMPRWACRHHAKVLGVRAERLQDISDEDVVAEGTLVGQNSPPATILYHSPTIELYRTWWTDLHNKRGTRWEDNPWVWVYGIEEADASKA